MKTIKLLVLLSLAYLVSACAPEVGSDAWCAGMDKKAKGDWSGNEATDYAKNCVFK
ncbi:MULTISPECIES: DUF3012 domain-containing protein [Zhongshania]|jgi:hypothetical protein|uniref:DUF3012 domain-containing protein n=1 Tax=Zhongshania aquimaris TaxID=2857107 RepID=A0ABS6VMS2_9GAMM|nr:MULTISPECIES: DUF3012 domain-containing protein [Zhongshania]MBQ0796682.1 DUF3012 domain-containing protein [Zhongshania sp.]MBW2939613.1 DUF3012 domain-containing protein [Zhongshania aquimaris]